MARRVLLGVQKKRSIRRNKKKLLKKVIDYLISDSYMFAPLISLLPSSFSSPMKSPASVTGFGVEGKQPIKENKRLLKKVGDYLKSDSYMYASLLVRPQSISSPPKGSSRYLEKVTSMAVSKRKLILKDRKPNEQLENVVTEDQASKGYLTEKIISEQQSLVHKETVKHVVNHSCRSSLMSGKRMLRSQLRKLVD